jgi:hypothetical protein
MACIHLHNPTHSFSHAYCNKRGPKVRIFITTVLLVQYGSYVSTNLKTWRRHTTIMLLTT